MLKVSYVLRIISRLARPVIQLTLVLLMIGVTIRPANAGIIDHIEVRQAGDEAEIKILFVTQIEYLRQATLTNGAIRFYFNILGMDALDTRLVPENKESPPSDIAPHFSISYPELDSSLSIRFGKAVDYHVRPGKNGRSISIFTPALKPKDESELSAPRPVEIIEQEAQQLIGSARYALQNDRAEMAIGTLNKLLNLPPNQQSQSAQELIGDAWEKNGEFDKARVEYELYLELYPDAKDIRKVKEKLAGLPPKGTKKPVKAAVAKPKLPEEGMVFYGGLSQYYYKGTSHTDSLNISGATSTASSFTREDQSQLLSLLDLTGRKRTDSTDTRMVFRDSYNANFLPGQLSYNRLDAAYIEQNSRNHTYMYRLGRQSGAGGGAPGRFDGAVAGYSFNPTIRVNGVIGVPVEYSSGGLGSSNGKDFAGMSVDLTRLSEQLSSSWYLIQQRVNGEVDRRAIGADARYFDAQRNFMGLVEYDTLFKKVNLGMIQGNWTTESSTNYNLLVDHRRSPPLQLSNALIGQTLQSVSELLQSGKAMSTIRADAKALSPISNMFGIGMNSQYSPRVRLGGDFRVSNMSGTGATSSGQQATEGSGNTYSYSVQATGNNLFLENDYGVVNASYTSSKTYKGQSLAFTQVETFRQYWRVDTLLFLYNQTDDTGTHRTQIRPSFKLNYRWNDSVNLEGEAGIEQTKVSSATQNDKTRRRYFYVGYRWDFR